MEQAPSKQEQLGVFPAPPSVTPLVTLTIIAAMLCSIAVPTAHKLNRRALYLAEVHEQNSDVKQLFYLLVDFDREFGRYPETIDELQRSLPQIGHPDADIQALLPTQDFVYYGDFSATTSAAPLCSWKMELDGNFFRWCALRRDGSLMQFSSEEKLRLALKQLKPAPTE